MRALVQRAARAEVRVAGEVVGRIGRGLVVFLGVGRGDGDEEVHAMARKIARLRIFGDADGKMNDAVTDFGGEALVVSQFTLYGDTRRGNRPGFSSAAPPAEANRLYLAFTDALRGHGLGVATGVFGADMQVDLVNDGPVTLWLELPPVGDSAGAHASG